MFSVFDVAQYIIQRYGGTIRVSVLQKLVYYCQAWSLVWDNRPLFWQIIEARASGPLVPDLFDKYKKNNIFTIGAENLRGLPGIIDRTARETINAVVDFYGEMSPQQLSDLARNEAPWKDAWLGLEPKKKIWGKITSESMKEYYKFIPPHA